MCEGVWGGAAADAVQLLLSALHLETTGVQTHQTAAKHPPSLLHYVLIRTCMHAA
jgi:hypothetical protein